MAGFGVIPFALLNVCLFLPLGGTAFAQFPCECLRAGSTPEANGSSLNSITFAFDRFIAVGYGGAVITSTNGITWLRQPAPTTSALYAVTSGGGAVVAVGDSGCVLLSTNGSDWELRDAGTTNDLRGVAYGNGQFVALTARSTLLTSSNATSWLTTLNATPYGWPLYGLFFGGGLFFACGGPGLVVTSADGLNWTPGYLPAYCYFSCGAYGNGVFVVAGKTMGYDQTARSTNGVTWTTQRLQEFSALCYGGGLFLGCGLNYMQWSVDGNSWMRTTVPATVRGVAYGLGQYAVVGDGGAILTATDPSVWTLRNLTVCPIAAFAEGNGLSVGITIDFAVIYSSEDNVHYTLRRPPGGFLTSLLFGNGLFVATGSVGILVSSDATNWTSVPYLASGAVQALLNQEGVWVAFSQNIISSVDATNWVVRVPSSGYLTGCVYGNGQFGDRRELYLWPWRAAG